MVKSPVLVKPQFLKQDMTE